MRSCCCARALTAANTTAAANALKPYRRDELWIFTFPAGSKQRANKGISETVGKIIHVQFEGALPVDRRIPKPSPRENQVLQLWGSGYEADEIAAVLGIACGTVRTRLNGLRGIVGVRTTRELRSIARAWQCGFERLYVPIDRVPVKEPLSTSRASAQLRAQRGISGFVCL